MISTIIQQDWWLIRQSTLYKILALVFISCLVVAGINGHRLYQNKIRTHAAIDSAQHAATVDLKAQLEKIESGEPYLGSPFADPRSPYAVGNSYLPHYLVFSLHPLAQWSTGQSDVQPTYYRVNASKMQSLLVNDEIANPRIQFSGYLDISFVLIYLLPLFIIGFTYNLSSSEFESGTLRMLLSEPVSFQRIMAVKFLFRFIMASLGLWVVLLMAAAVSSIPLSDGNLWQFILYAWAYACFWFALSWFVNSLSRTNSGTTAAVMLVTWLSFVILIPGIISMIAKSAFPMPSRIELITKTREAAAQTSKRNSDVLGKYLQDHPDLVKDTAGLNPNDFAVKAFTAVLEIERSVAPLENSFDMQLAGQQKVAGKLGYFSPALIFQSAMNSSAMTGETSFIDFKHYVTDFFKRNREFYTNQIIGQKKFTSKGLIAIPLSSNHDHSTTNSRTYILYLSLLTLALVAFGILGFRKVTI
jgi:ABC-2 type transport system permease protein